jgi:hypothetical protein
MIIAKDSFTSGQILSKLWLCEQLEQTSLIKRPITIWLYGGWYATTALLLLSRGKMNIRHIRNHDIDTVALDISKQFLDSWTYNNPNLYSTVAIDVNDIKFESYPDLIINTSTEHMESKQWYDNIPKGITCAFQSNDMPHDDHCHTVSNHKELLNLYPLSKVLYSGVKKFDYPDWSFTRSMIIGIK